tara:strand:- start:133 stop:282 length:150 start_codon:yes stop_codon:yes gene_type:complete
LANELAKINTQLTATRQKIDLLKLPKKISETTEGLRKKYAEVLRAESVE